MENCIANVNSEGVKFIRRVRKDDYNRIIKSILPRKKQWLIYSRRIGCFLFSQKKKIIGVHSKTEVSNIKN
jgi:hypothetical protein